MLSQDPKNLQNSSEVTFYMLNNNFPYTQVASAHVRDNTDAFFSFSYSAKFLYLSLAFFFLLKDFDIFYKLLLEAFICVFDNTYLPFLYIQKKVIKIIFYKV